MSTHNICLYGELSKTKLGSKYNLPPPTPQITEAKKKSNESSINILLWELQSGITLVIQILQPHFFCQTRIVWWLWCGVNLNKIGQKISKLQSKSFKCWQNFGMTEWWTCWKQYTPPKTPFCGGYNKFQVTPESNSARKATSHMLKTIYLSYYDLLKKYILFLYIMGIQICYYMDWWQTSSEVGMYFPDVSHIMRKPVFAICEQQRRRSACASAQSDQCLCYSLLR